MLGSDFRTVCTVNSAHGRPQFSPCGQRCAAPPGSACLGFSRPTSRALHRAPSGSFSAASAQPVGSRGRSLSAPAQGGARVPLKPRGEGSARSVRGSLSGVGPRRPAESGLLSWQGLCSRGSEEGKGTAVLRGLSGLKLPAGVVLQDVCVSRIHVPFIKSPPCGRRAAGFQAWGAGGLREPRQAVRPLRCPFRHRGPVTPAPVCCFPQGSCPLGEDLRRR